MSLHFVSILPIGCVWTKSEFVSKEGLEGQWKKERTLYVWKKKTFNMHGTVAPKPQDGGDSL
jgi:hypothetical protein